MGKIILQETTRLEQAGTPRGQGVLTGQQGVLEQQAREFREYLGRAEQTFDLDELDHIARRYARHPASGCPEALEALAVVARCAPDSFARTEVNLDPGRLENLADRYRALGVLAEPLTRFADLVKDSHMELGDEIVELLTVGWSRASGLGADMLLNNERLTQAMGVLAEYQQRIIEERAHRSNADHEPVGKKRR